ncbi:MAG TPA: ATP-binding protein [Microbacteriaceae bacterium]|mgnify:CR=1 FL=1|jgi:two-component system OmpR family sensor kinase|nr:ATP-binding protein [Microbacteriaceae bacterium]HQX34862.1 ATP-binding protein [Microbacteriaceae bacterium]HQZ48580.1 ATP-binding protein [Microbacteriaceae bacterium]HRA09625.1 ATP-binding protein [Microbacteriaceae bacterium]
MSQAPATATPPPARWSLQRRLMVTVVGIVSLLVILVALTSAATLGRVLEQRLDSQLWATTQRVNAQLGESTFPAYTTNPIAILSSGAQPSGLLIAVYSAGTTSGAWISPEGLVQALDSAQLSDLARGVTSGPSGPADTVELGGDLGSYRISTTRTPTSIAIVGLPRAEVQQTITELLVTIALVTAGGLLVLGAATALVVQLGLRPLKSIAGTAARVARQPLSSGAVTITERVPVAEADPRTEIGQVGAALNTLLDHVDTALDDRHETEERMRRFVADASHELRTPLSSIRGYTELTLRDPTLGELATASLERIQAQSLRMTTLVEDLLLLARLEEGQELVYGSVDLSLLAVEAVSDAHAAYRDHRFMLDVPDAPVVIAGDASRLAQVFANLLANAGTHSPPGTAVTVTVEPQAEYVVLSVRDAGPGIDPELRDELFARFARADRSRSRGTGGSGLGLSIVRAIVEAHHGQITVQSTPGDTVFAVRLPVRRPNQADEPA